MKLYFNNLLLFIKTRFSFFAYIGLNLLLMIYSLYSIFQADSSIISVLSHQQNLLKFTSIVFIVFLFSSFFYFSKAKNSDLIENISVSSSGKSHFFLSQFFVVLTFAFITFIISFLLSIIISYQFSIHENQYTLYLLKISFYYFFLSDIIAILIGLFCSQTSKRNMSYIILLLSVILFSPVSNRIPNTIFMATEKINLFGFFDLFEIYPSNFNTINHAYAIAANSHSLSVILFWISLLLLITVFSLSFRINLKKSFSILICLCVFVMTLTDFIQPYSQAAHNLDPKKGFSAEAWHYLTTQPKDSPMQYNQESDFKITSYEMNFSINKELEATVHVYIDKSNLEKYVFTLYHGYNVTDVSDDKGKKLKYDRYDDYISVYPNRETNVLSFSYKGHSPLYYSNSQGVYLPAGFAYYPINGMRYVYDVGKQGRIAQKLEQSVPIKVNIKSKTNLFCNLDKLNNQSFEGISDGVTFVSGFYNEITIDNTRLVYKYLDTVSYSKPNIEITFRDYLDKFPQNKGKTIILTPENHSLADDEKKFELSDHIVADSLESAFYNTAHNDNVNIHLDLYYTFLNYYNQESELYKLSQKNINELPKDDDNLNIILAKKIIKYGPESTYIKVLNAQMDFENNSSLLELAKSIDKY